MNANLHPSLKAIGHYGLAATEDTKTFFYHADVHLIITVKDPSSKGENWYV